MVLQLVLSLLTFSILPLYLQTVAKSRICRQFLRFYSHAFDDASLFLSAVCFVSILIRLFVPPYLSALLHILISRARPLAALLSRATTRSLYIDAKAA